MFIQKEKTVRSFTYFYRETAVKRVLPREKKNLMRQKLSVFTGNQYIIRPSILVHSTQKATTSVKKTQKIYFEGYFGENWGNQNVLSAILTS